MKYRNIFLSIIFILSLFNNLNNLISAENKTIRIFSDSYTLDGTDSTVSFINDGYNSETTIINEKYISNIQSEISKLEISDQKIEKQIYIVAIIEDANKQDTITLTAHTKIVKINEKFYKSTFKLIDLLLQYIPTKDSYFLETYKYNE